MEDLTEYDVFLAVAGRPSADVALLQKSLWLNDSTALEALLKGLCSKKLLKLNRDNTYERVKSSETENLLRILLFALAYDYNYNVYLSDNFFHLLQEGYEMGAFSERALPEGTYGRDLMLQLMHDKLVLNLTYSPFTATLLHTPFFDYIITYKKLKLKTSFFHSNPNYGRLVLGKEIDLHNQELKNIMLGANYFFKNNRNGLDFFTRKIQKILAFDLEPFNKEFFDEPARNNFKRGLETARSNAQDHIKPLSENIIKEYHRIVMNGTNCPSEYRDHEVVIRNNSNFKTASYKQVPKKMQEFMQLYLSRLPKMKKNVNEVLALVAWVYSELVHIHPFADGNSRTAMLAMMHVIHSFNISYLQVIPPSFDYHFIQATKGAKKRNDKNVFDVLQQIRLLNLNEQEYQTMLGLL